MSQVKNVHNAIYMLIYVFNIDLCRSISVSLPQQERLEKLMEASMRVSVVGSEV